MQSSPEPVVGEWYRTLEGDKFEVIAVDEDEQSIEIQYYGGDIDEVDVDSWSELELQRVAPSEDWSAPYDVPDREDLGYVEPIQPLGGHQSALNEIERDED